MIIVKNMKYRSSKSKNKLKYWTVIVCDPNYRS